MDYSYNPYETQIDTTQTGRKEHEQFTAVRQLRPPNARVLPNAPAASVWIRNVRAGNTTLVRVSYARGGALLSIELQKQKED